MNVDDEMEIILRTEEKPANNANASFSIILDEDAHRQMLAYAATDLNREMAGVILGSYEQHGEGIVVWVKAAIEARDALGERASVKFTHKSWEHINEVKDRFFPELKIVGWFHTHPGFGIFLSEYDRFIHKNFFNLPWQVAFVADPRAKTEGFFRWFHGELVPAGYKTEQTGFENGGYSLPAIPAPVTKPDRDVVTGMDACERSGGTRLKPWQAAVGAAGLAAIFLAGYWVGMQKTPLPSPEKTVPPAIVTLQPGAGGEKEETRARVVYRHRVRRGDNLWNISELYYGTGFRYQEIADFNHIGPDLNIRVGQVLEIPRIEEGAR